MLKDNPVLIGKKTISPKVYTEMKREQGYRSKGFCSLKHNNVQ